MNIDKLVFRVAGGFILISLLLAWLFSYYWLWVTVFVGANMVQSTFTGFCPSAKLFKYLGVKPGQLFD